MRWLMPLFALMALAIGAAWLDRHPTPMISKPFEVTQQTPGIKAQKEPERPPEYKQNSDGHGSAPASETSQDHTPKGGNPTEERGTEFLPVIFGIRLKITDTLLVLFTAVLAASTILLWNTTERGFTELERPWIHFTPIENNFASAWGQVKATYAPTVVRFEMRFMFVNYGRSPAILTDLTLSIDVKPFIPPSDGGAATQLKGNPVIRSGGHGFEYLVWADVQVNPSNMGSILDGTERLWCWGSLTYQDAGSSSVSQRKFIAEFLWRFDGETDSFSPFNPDGEDRNRRT